MTLSALAENLRSRPIILLGLAVAVVSLVLVFAISFTRKENPQDQKKQEQAKSFTTPTRIEGGVLVPARVQEVSPKELDSLLKSGQKIKLVHLATASEWQAEHLANSIFLSFEEVSKGDVSLPQNEKIVFISKDGVESVLAVQKLVDIYGFSRDSVRSLKGGLKAWKAAGLKVER